MRYAVTGATTEQVKAVGGSDIKEARSTNIIFATLTNEQVAKLQSSGSIVTVVKGVKASVMPPIPVSAQPLYSAEELFFQAGYEDFRRMMAPPLYGSGFYLAMIDTGCLETHEMIKGRVVHSKNFTTAEMRDGYNHGTGTTSIAVAIAPQCNILNLKVLDDKGEGSEEEVVMAIDYCLLLRDEGAMIAPQVINLSLGSIDDGNPNNPLRVACRAAIERNIWVFASCGNNGPAAYTITSPACERYVGALGCIKYEPFNISDFSSRGPTKEGLIKPDGVLFGEDMIMASSISDTATIAKSGTSFSAPFVSGMAILTREGIFRQAMLTTPMPGIVYEEAWAMSEEDLLDKYLPLICIKPEGVIAGKDTDYGWGLPFASAVMQMLGLRPLMDISSLIGMVTPILGLAMVGMIILPATNGMK